MSDGLDSDQGKDSVGPDLGSNCLQGLSADDKSLLLSLSLEKKELTLSLHLKAKDCHLLTFFTLSKNTIRVSNVLHQDQDRHYVGSDLGPNCLQRLATDDKSCH